MEEIINTEEYEVPYLQPSKLNMEDYGKLLEEYDYKLENGKVKEIAYSQFDENGNEIKCVGISDDDGHYHRSVVIWPNLDENGYPEGYLNSTVLEMKLDLDSIDPAFDLSKVQLYDYYNAEKKTDDTFIIPVPNPIGDGVLVDMEADKDVKIAYYKDLNLYKSYQAGENVSDEDEKIFTSNNRVYIVSKVKSEKTYVVLLVDEDYDGSTVFRICEQFSGKERIVEDNPIDIISETCYKTVEYCDHKLTYSYDPDGTVSRVEYTLDDGTTGLISRVETDLKSIGDCKEYDEASFIRRKAISLYPALVTLNDELFIKYNNWTEFMWAYDVADYDEEGNMIEFSRSIYMVDTKKEKEFINYFTHNDKWPILL